MAPISPDTPTALPPPPSPLAVVRAGGLYWAGLILGLGLLVLAGLELDRTRQLAFQTADERRWREDLPLLGHLLAEPLQAGDRSRVQRLLEQWGQSHGDTVELRLSGAHDSLPEPYLRPRPARRTRQLHHRIPTADGQWITLTQTRDQDALVRDRAHWRLQAGVVLGVITLTLGLATWSLARRRLERQLTATRLTEILAQLQTRDREAEALRIWLDLTLDHQPAMVIGVTGDGRIAEWSRQATRQTCIERQDALGLPLADLLPQLGVQLARTREAPPDTRPRPPARIAAVVNGAVRYSDVTIQAPDPDGPALIRVEDVTAAVRARQGLLQGQKLAFLGSLAAGVVHELTNPLSGVLQNLQNMQRRLAPDLPANQNAAAACGLDLQCLAAYLEQRRIPEFLDLTRAAAGRASAIVRDMLAMGRQGAESMQPLPAEDLLEAALALASQDPELNRRLEFRRIRIERDYTPDLPRVRGHRIRLERALLTLILHAAESLHRYRIPDPRRIVLRTARDATRVCIEVQDNGPGMDDQVRGRLFELPGPDHWHTAPDGLGLAVARYIVQEQHRGRLEAEPAPGGGDLLRLCLPPDEGNPLPSGTPLGFARVIA
jgi:C4-dicarboxylate-specific signal transduction histidine kinase